MVTGHLYSLCCIEQQCSLTWDPMEYVLKSSSQKHSNLVIVLNMLCVDDNPRWPPAWFIYYGKIYKIFNLDLTQIYV